MEKLSGWSRLFILFNGIWAVLAALWSVIFSFDSLIYITSFLVPISLWLLVRSIAWVREGFR